jgi:hypothetical protein
MTGKLAHSPPFRQEKTNLLASVTKLLPNGRMTRRAKRCRGAEMAAGDPFASSMAAVSPDAPVDGILRFVKLHVSCYGISLDTPPLPRLGGYRAVVACRCGDTIEYWLDDATLPRPHLLAALSTRHAA